MQAKLSGKIIQRKFLLSREFLWILTPVLKSPFPGYWPGPFSSHEDLEIGGLFHQGQFPFKVDVRQGESNIFQISTWKAFLLLKIYLLWKIRPISAKRWKPVWIRACPIVVLLNLQHSLKWARGPHNLARFPSWDPWITPGYGVRGVSQIKFTMSDSFLVLYGFDILSMIKRKNPFGFYCVILILDLSRLISLITILISKVCRVWFLKWHFWFPKFIAFDFSNDTFDFRRFDFSNNTFDFQNETDMDDIHVTVLWVVSLTHGKAKATLSQLLHHDRTRQRECFSEKSSLPRRRSSSSRKK